MTPLDIVVFVEFELEKLYYGTSDLNFHVLGGLGPRLLGAIAL